MIIFVVANKNNKPIKTEKEMKKNKKKNEKSEVKVEQAAVQQKPTSEKQSNSDETSAEMEMVLPEYTEPTYQTGQLILSKDIDLVNEDVKADAEIGRDTLKSVVEIFSSARFTRISKTRAIVTAEKNDLESLSTWLKNYFKRGIMITAL